MTSPAPSAAAPLTGRDIRTLGLSALGGALEFYDFIIFVYFVVVLGHLFFPPGIPDWLVQFQAFGISRPSISGAAAGRNRPRPFRRPARPQAHVHALHFPDGAFHLRHRLPAHVRDYRPCGPVRCAAAAHGAGRGHRRRGAGAWVFVSEHVPERRVGLACGILTGGLTSGILLGALVATAINRSFSPQDIQAYAWRIPFFIGGVFGFCAVLSAHMAGETPVFQQMKARKALSEALPVAVVVRPSRRGSVILSVLLTWLLSGAIVVVILMTPTLLQTRYAIAPATALTANALATFFLTAGCIATGALCDRFGSAACWGWLGGTGGGRSRALLRRAGQSRSAAAAALWAGRAEWWASSVRCRSSWCGPFPPPWPSPASPSPTMWPMPFSAGSRRWW